MRLLAAGGTIAMRGEQAVPALDANELIEQLPQLASGPPLQTETILALPSAQLSLNDAFGLARRAVAAARDGEGVVITTGTDTMEEVAVLCALMHGEDAPIVITGANRPGSSPGADGPANLLDAVVLAGTPAAAGLGAVVAFGGEIHARDDRAQDRQHRADGIRLADRRARGPDRRAARVAARDADSAQAAAGRAAGPSRCGRGDGAGRRRRAARHAARSADGVVLVALGAGHLPPAVLGELRVAVERVPVVITCRPDRSSMLFSTYGFEGAEGDLRSSGAFCAPFLSAPAARMALVCCLGAGLDREGIGAALAAWDAG